MRVTDMYRVKCRTLINFLLLIFFIQTAIAQEFYAAGPVGEQLQLNLSAPNGFSLLIWEKYEQGNPNSKRLYGCSNPTQCSPNTANDPNGYYNLQPNDPEYNLEIYPFQADNALKYWASITEANAAESVDTYYYTIALEPLTCPEPVPEGVMEGTQVEIVCMSTYYQYKYDQSKILHPILEWSDDLGSDFNGLAVQNDTSDDQYSILTLNLTLTADYDDVTFYCKLTFSSDTGLEYEDNCTISYFVIHGVSTVDVGLDTSEGIPTVIVGDMINCTANGRPEPVFSWFDDEWIEISNTAVLEVTSDLLNRPQPVTCSCMATNTLPDGTQYEAFNNVTFYVSNGPIVKSGGVEPWVIAVSVVVPVVVLTAAGVGGYFFYRHRKNKKEKKKKSASNGSTRVNSSYTAVSTNPDPYPTRPTAAAAAYTAGPAAAPRNFTPTGSGTHTPAAGGYGALGVQYYTGSNTALNTSINSNAPSNRPAYPYNPSQGQAGGVSMNPNPNSRPNPVPPQGNPPYPYTGRQQGGSVASSVSSRSGYHPASPGFVPQPRPSHASSLSGSEV